MLANYSMSFIALVKLQERQVRSCIPIKSCLVNVLKLLQIVHANIDKLFISFLKSYQLLISKDYKSDTLLRFYK